MSGEIAFDQSGADKILAAAESDTIEDRVANLEEEVAEIKGSIKALLVDIRQTMGVLENPFQNVQGIANISSAIVNPSPPGQDEGRGYSDEGLVPPEEGEGSEPDETEAALPEPLPESYFEDLKNASRISPKKTGSKIIDPISFNKTVVWSRDMVEKYDPGTIKELIEIFCLLGYISEDVKEIVLKLTHILSKSSDLDDVVMDLYRLYHILYPEDLSLDSRVLEYVLNENDAVKKLWQRK